MSDRPRIKTPWKQRWKRLRYQLIPFFAFLACLLMSGTMWKRHARPSGTVGEVQLVELGISAPMAGMLVQLPHRQIELYERVERGQPIARLDDRPVLAALNTVRAELARLQLELPAKEEEFRLDRDRAGQGRAAEARYLAVHVQDLKLRALDRRAQLEADRIELARQESSYESLGKGAASEEEASREELDARLRRDVIRERVKGGEAGLAEAEAQLEAARGRETELAESPGADLEKALAPLRGALAVQEARMRELDLLARSLEILSPISGRISNIQRVPGQAVMPGEPIATVVNAKGEYIVTFVRQDVRIRPAENAVVSVKPRVPGALPFRTTIARVGGHYGDVPSQQLRDRNTTEWGLPVLIHIPPAVDLKPGELVDVKYENK